MRLIIGAASPAAVPGVTTILATADPATRPSAGICVTGDEVVLQAYAIISGVSAAEMPGTQFLIDGAGWLRAVRRPAGTTGWDDPDRLAAAIRQLAAHPITASAGARRAAMQM